MHEFLLYSQIPASREHQVSSILAGVTGNQPVVIAEQELLWAQLKVDAPTTSKKFAAGAGSKAASHQAQQQQQLQNLVPSIHKLVRRIHTGSSSSDDSTKDGEVSIPEPWIFRAEGVPEPGTKEFLSRSVTAHEASAAELQRFADRELYSFRGQFSTLGKRFVHGNVVIRVYRMLNGSNNAATAADADPITATASPLRDDGEQSWVDPSGAFIVEAAIRITDSGSALLRDQATKELLAFKMEMDGAIHLYMPDRLALDTRVKGI